MSLLTALINSNKIYNFEQAFGVKDITTADMKTAITDWYGLYFDKTVTKDEDPCQRIPLTIVNKLTKTAFSEYLADTADKSNKGEFIKLVLDALDRIRKKAMQQALVGGLDYLKPVFLPDGGLCFRVIARPNMMVLARDDADSITSIGTAERTDIGKDHYTLLERRTVDHIGYLTIESKLYKSRDATILGDQVPLNTLEKYANLVPSFTFPQPVGSLGLIPIHTPLENCVDGSPDPVSVYAPAAGLIHNINRNEAQLNGEFERGKSRIFVDETMLKKRDGSKALTDDVFVGTPGDYQNGGISIFSPELREQSYLARKMEYLRNCESLIGLKRGLLSEVEAVERTAKEITSSEGDYNLTIIDFQEMWEDAVREAVRVCVVLGRMYKQYSGPDIDTKKDVTISWGNGILYDEDKTWSEYQGMVSAGLLKPEIAVGWYFDMPTETPADLQKIREKYMPEIEKMADDGGGEE